MLYPLSSENIWQLQGDKTSSFLAWALKSLTLICQFFLDSYLRLCQECHRSIPFFTFFYLSGGCAIAMPQLKTFPLIRSAHSPGDIASNAITRRLHVTHICCKAFSKLPLSIMTSGDRICWATYSPIAPPAHLFYWPSHNPAPPDAMRPYSNRILHEQISKSLIHL
jgi:hypothetical protein